MTNDDKAELQRRQSIRQDGIRHTMSLFSHRPSQPPAEAEKPKAESVEPARPLNPGEPTL